MDERSTLGRLIVREEEADDVESIRRVETLAFGQPDEARIVDALRDAGAVTLSLVAEVSGEVVGHLLFSPVRVGTDDGEVPLLGLAPLAVLSEHRGRGIGARLVREGLAMVRARGHGAAVVLGEPKYYARFGFSPAAERRLRWEHPCPPEVFMVLELVPDTLPRDGGVVRYRAEFGGA